VANVFTSIATTPGFADNTVKLAWDLVLERVAKERRIFRQFIDKRPEKPSLNGNQVNLSLYDYLSAATVTAAKTPLSEEVDPDSVKLPATQFVTLTFNEYGFTTLRTEKLNQMTFVDSLDAYAAEAVGLHMADTIDEIIQDIIVATNNKLFSSTATAINQVTAAMTLDSEDVRRAVTKLRAGLARPWDTSGMYAAVAHPHVVHDIRQETGSGGWRVPAEYSAGMNSKIWNGEFGEHEGARFVQATTVRTALDGAAAAKVYRTPFFGRQGIAEGVLIEPGLRVGPVVDKLMRFRPVGWYGIAGWVLYRPEAIVVLHSGSSVAAL
jgi:N4-gp56 family major capsid protein